MVRQFRRRFQLIGVDHGTAQRTHFTSGVFFDVVGFVRNATQHQLQQVRVKTFGHGQLGAQFGGGGHDCFSYGPGTIGRHRTKGGQDFFLHETFQRLRALGKKSTHGLERGTSNT